MTDYELGIKDCMQGLPSRNLSKEYLDGYGHQYEMEARNDSK